MIGLMMTVKDVLNSYKTMRIENGENKKMGANKNIYDPTNTSHGHFCQRCRYHWYCSLKRCLKKAPGDEFAEYYWETKPEKVFVQGCAFCKELSDAKCAEIIKVIPSYHFGKKDDRLATII